MTPLDAQHLILGPALSLLPPAMDTPEARAMLIAIALQESALKHRRQIEGPARGFWQFERPGLLGVLKHRASRDLAAGIAERLIYPVDAWLLHPALEHNDLLAAVFARLLLWTLPAPLPTRDQAVIGWVQYLDAWRPGRPHPDTWAGHWDTAWRSVA